MKKGILLVMPPAWGIEMPPLNLGILKAALIKQGFQAEAMDLNIDAMYFLGTPALFQKNTLEIWSNKNFFEEKIQPLLEPFLNQMAQKIALSHWDAVGLSLIDSNIHCANLLAHKIKALCQKPILAGGPQTTFKEMRVKIDKAIDYYLVGEGEEAIGEWLNWLENTESALPEGFYSRKDELHRDLPYRQSRLWQDGIIPDFSDFLKAYASQGIPLIFSRSCIFKCSFCSDFSSMGPYRKLSKARILEQFEAVYRQGYRSVWLNDLLINGNLSEILAALETFAQSGHQMEWIALATPNAVLSSEILHKLKAYGLKTLNLGLESGSSKVMRLMRKGFNKYQAKKALQRIFEAGINTQLNVIVGYPGEEEEDFLETLEFLAENRPYICGFTSVNTCILIPGSEIHHKRAELGLVMPEENPSAWSMPGNNLEIRQNRLNRLMQWIQKEGFEIYITNLSAI